MGIYQRDQINYQSMIDNMIKNRMHTAERDADRIVKMADIKAQTAKDIASTIARGMDYAQYASEASELENKLKDLEERRDYIRSQYDYNADYNPYTSTDAYKASEQMKDYKPGSTYIVGDAKSKWMQSHPGMTEEDYDNYINYMNSIYGGR